MGEARFDMLLSSCKTDHAGRMMPRLKSLIWLIFIAFLLLLSFHAVGRPAGTWSQ